MSKTVPIAHLGGAHIGYKIAGPIKQSRPSVVLINSFTSNADSYKAQLTSGDLAEVANLVAIEPFGHGDTKLKSTDTFTFWDTAYAIVQVLDALGIRKAFILGTSQGGWIATRVALYAPDRVLGIIPIGTSLDSETDKSRTFGNWDSDLEITPSIKETEPSAQSANFKPSDDLINRFITLSLGEDIDAATRTGLREGIQKQYSGETGRKLLRQSSINVRDRDGLHSRLPDIRCPVLWLHGDQDKVFTVAHAQEEIKLFVNSPSATLQIVEGGQHLAGVSHPEVVNKAILDFVTKYSDKPDARKLREAVGMIDI